MEGEQSQQGRWGGCDESLVVLPIGDPLMVPLLLFLAVAAAVIGVLVHVKHGLTSELRPPSAQDVAQTGDIGGAAGRRRFLKLIGIGAAGAVPAAILPVALRTRSEAAGAAEEPARGPRGRVRQWTMIIDLRFCDGCQSQGTPPQCTTACIEGHLAPQPMEWIQVFEQDLPGGGTQFIPTPCLQCQNPPCVNVCPVGATFSTPEGVVLIDQERCIGCRICMAACPYDRRFFNWSDPPVPPEALLADYSPDHQVPATKGTVMKCDMCPDLARAGTLPYCIQACPNDAIYYGDLEEDIATNGRSVMAVSRFLTDNQAYQLKQHLGTKPRVYYVAGHGQAVGRDPYTTGRLPTEWPWVRRVEGAKVWNR